MRVVTEDPETDPALHARGAFVAAAGEPMAPLVVPASPAMVVTFFITA